MWAVYWRFLLAVFIVFSIAAFTVLKLSILSLIENNRYHSTVFWLFTTAIAIVLSIPTSKGLAHSFFGDRLNFSPYFWRLINVSFIVLFLFLAVLAFAFQAFATASIWANYKLYFQPAALIFYPWLAGRFVLHRVKHNNQQ